MIDRSCKLTSEFGTKANSSHNHTSSDITDFDSSADTRITVQKGNNNGIAPLDGTGKIPTNHIPPIALTSVQSVADITARDALVVEEGDVAMVTDTGAGDSGARKNGRGPGAAGRRDRRGGGAQPAVQRPPRRRYTNVVLRQPGR